MSRKKVSEKTRKAIEIQNKIKRLRFEIEELELSLHQTILRVPIYELEEFVKQTRG